MTVLSKEYYRGRMRVYIVVLQPYDQAAVHNYIPFGRSVSPIG